MEFVTSTYLLDAEDGYVYDFAARKLRTASMQPIRLDLMYTCRIVAREMRGMALRLHTVTFSTVYSEDVRGTAGLWDTIMQFYHGHPFPKLYQLQHLVPLMSDQMAAEVGRRYGGTHFYQVFCRIRIEGLVTDDSRYRDDDAVQGFGEVPSVFRDMARDVLQLALTDPAILQFATTVAEHGDFEYQLLPAGDALSGLAEEPWQAPTASQADSLGAKLAGTDSIDRPVELTTHWYRCDVQQSRGSMSRFSAAAAAINFLESIPDSRAQFRNIVLHEDRISVAFPQCHVRGLVPFCHENPDLRIERRVSLWRNIFLTTPWTFRGWCRELDDLFLGACPDFYGNPCILEADTITRRVAEYMVEAAQPQVPEAITLVLDGAPLPSLASRIFSETVQRDAAWQTALERAFAAPEEPPGAGATATAPVDALYVRRAAPYQFAGFPELLRAVCAGSAGAGAGGTPTTCRVRCNFDPGEPWDDARIEAEIERPVGRGADLRRWTELWERGDTGGYGTEPPLPPYHRMFEENVLCLPYAPPEWD
ncbi:hypothetical protein GE09DRAFT_1255099 [Coniochaeta sp. 2T2.1]|nr:hypothetical protein GE09DRAFT_1255099 [Coniochaeta sp. 2T2.1]